MNAKYIFYKTKRGRTGIIAENYTFYCVDKTATIYKCTEKSCGVRATIVDDMYVTLSGFHKKHNSDADKKIKRKLLVDNIKRMANSSCLNGREILSNVRSSFDAYDNLVVVPTDKYLQQIIRNERKKVEDNCSDENGIFLKYYLTENKEKFIQFISMKDEKLIILLNEENKVYLETSNNWICDGTFYACPKEFVQLYVIHVEISGLKYPIAYLFLPFKTYKCYFHAFSLFSKIINFKNPKTIVIDFEFAAQKALSEIFSTTTIFYCNFHMGQSFFRKIQKFGLSLSYNNDKKFRNFMRMVLALAYETPCNVISLFNELSQKILSIYENDNVKELLNYFDKTYVGTSKNPTFQIQNWSCHWRILNNVPTTTNTAEAWNKGLNGLFNSAHPKLNDLIKEIRTRDILTSIKIQNDLVNSVIAKVNLKNEKLKNFLLERKNYSGLSFLMLISLIRESY